MRQTMKVDQLMLLFVLLFLMLAFVTETEAMICYPDHPQTAFCRSHFAIQAKIVSRTPMAQTPVTKPLRTTTSAYGIAATTHANKQVSKSRPVTSGKTTGGRAWPTADPGIAPGTVGTVIENKDVPVAGPEPNDNLYKARVLDMYKLPLPEIARVNILKIFKGARLLNVSQYDTIDLNIQNPWHPDLQVSGIYLITGFVFPEAPQPIVSMCNWNALWDSVTLVQHWGLKMYYEKSCKCPITFCVSGDTCDRDPEGCLWEVPAHEIGSARSDCKSKKGVCMRGRGACEWYIPSLSCKEPVWP